MTILNEEIKVGNKKLKNRLVMAPIALEKSDHGKVTEELLSYYDKRTKSSNIGLVVIEHSFIREDGRASKNQLSILEDSDIIGLKKLSNIIHKNGSKVIIQISHAGSAAKKEVTNLEAISPSGLLNPIGALGVGGSKNSKTMTKKDINEIVNSFVNAAIRAKKAGFDGCEIHSAHGYLLNQFYSPLTNKRTDEYNGNTIDGRILIHLEIIREIRKALGDDFIISMRFGGCDYTNDGSTINDSVKASIEFEKAGLDILDVSGGMCFFTRAGHNESGYFSDMTEKIKEEVSIPVILTGGIKSKSEADQLLRDKKSDMIGIGRAISRKENWAEVEMTN